MTSTAPIAPDDPRAALARSADQIERLLADLQPDELTAATPCDDFTVTELTAHLCGVQRRIAAVLAGAPWESTPSTYGGEPSLATWQAERAATDRVLADHGVLTATVSVPWGQVTGAEALAGYVGEFTVHGWDLASALGRSDQLDPALAEAALATYRRMLPPGSRPAEIPFDDEVVVADDADAYAKLVAFTGRDPLPAPAS